MRVMIVVSDTLFSFLLFSPPFTLSVTEEQQSLEIAQGFYSATTNLNSVIPIE